jgi:hypothetical protein
VNEARKVMELGEIKYNALQLREARRWISSHPARFIKLSIMRFIAFWMPTENLNNPYAGLTPFYVPVLMRVGWCSDRTWDGA